MLADKLIVGRCGVGDATRLNIAGGTMRGRASQKLEKTVGNSSVCLCQCPCSRSTTDYGCRKKRVTTLGKPTQMFAMPGAAANSGKALPQSLQVGRCAV